MGTRLARPVPKDRPNAAREMLMKRLLYLVPVVVLLMATINAAPPAALTTEGTSALSTFFTDAVARGDVPGVVALVVDRDKVLYHEAFGKQNVAKNVPMALATNTPTRRLRSAHR